MERILGIDLGDRRIGFAVSDALGITAQGLETYTRAADEPAADVEYAISMAKKHSVSSIVFGMPRNMDGSYGFASDKVKDFAKLVSERYDGKISFFDERLSTVSAERVLCDAKLDWKKRRKVVDKLAAVVILQAYLDSGAHTSAQNSIV